MEKRLSIKKLMILVVVALSICVCVPMIVPEKASALGWGWHKENNKWHYKNYANGCYSVNGKVYYFNSAGELPTKKGWYNITKDYPEAHTCISVNGASVETSVKERAWIYINADGSLATGWKKINGKWYYFGRTMYSLPNGHIYCFTLYANAWGIATHPVMSNGMIDTDGWIPEKYYLLLGTRLYCLDSNYAWTGKSYDVTIKGTDAYIKWKNELKLDVPTKIMMSDSQKKRLKESGLSGRKY